VELRGVPPKELTMGLRYLLSCLEGLRAWGSNKSSPSRAHGISSSHKIILAHFKCDKTLLVEGKSDTVNEKCCKLSLFLK